MIDTSGTVPQHIDDHDDCPLCNTLEDDPGFASSILAAAEDLSEAMTADEMIAWLLR